MYLKVIRLLIHLLFLLGVAYSSEQLNDNPFSAYIDSYNKNVVEEILLNNYQDKFPFKHLSRLEQAAMFGLNNLIVLIHNDAPLEFKNHANEAIYSAAGLGQIESVNLLLDLGVSPDSKIESGLTPIYSATQFGEKEIVKKLLEAGADYSWKIENTPSLIVVAYIEKRHEIIELLLNHGYKISKEENELIMSIDNLNDKNKQSETQVN